MEVEWRHMGGDGHEWLYRYRVEEGGGGGARSRRRQRGARATALEILLDKAAGQGPLAFEELSFDASSARPC